MLATLGSDTASFDILVVELEINGIQPIIDGILKDLCVFLDLAHAGPNSMILGVSTVKTGNI